MALIAVCGVGAVGAGMAVADSESGSGDAAGESEAASRGPGPMGMRGEAPEELQDFTDCMREQGIEPPKRGDRPDSRAELKQRHEEFEQKREELHAAMQACKDKLPEEARQQLEDAEQFRDCMEENGAKPSERPDADTFRGALKECARYAPVPQFGRPGFGPGPPHGGPGGFVMPGPPPGEAG